MSIERNGVVVPFNLSVSRIRQHAADCRRRGMPAQAVTLLRQAADRDDSPRSRMELAETLLSLGCFEQALPVLYRLLSHPDAPDAVWLLLARCQDALDNAPAAIDALYHFLSDDPYSSQADDARRMLGRLEAADARREMIRYGRLLQRAMDAWQRDDRKLAGKRFRRAAHIAAYPERVYAARGLLLLTADDLPAAYRFLSAALRRKPDDPRTATALSLVLYGTGLKRDALDQLHRSAPLCQSPAGEPLYITSALAMRRTDEAVAYLRDRLRRQPCRIALMHALAPLLYQTGSRDEAELLWQQILGLDPGDQQARIQLERIAQGTEPLLLSDAEFLRREIRSRLSQVLDDLLEEHEDGLDADLLLQPGSASRQLIDWIFEHPLPDCQHPLLDFLQAHGEGALLAPWLRSLLALPTVDPDLANRILTYLHDHGHTQPTPILVGARIGVAQCVEDADHPRRWPMFLRALLTEALRDVPAMPLAYRAAQWWQLLTENQQLDAIGARQQDYVMAMKLLYLLDTGKLDTVRRLLGSLKISKRRVGRIIFRLQHGAASLKGDHTHEMH